MRLAQLKERLFPGGFRRTGLRWRSQIFRRVSQRDLVKLLQDLGLPAGAMVCIHSRLSDLGYLPKGPQQILEAVFESAPGSTILMPTFPFAGSQLDWIRSGAVFDVRSTPSKSGVLSEALRRFPGALRSLHPTHPCAACGPRAAELIAGSEDSVEPFGPESAYGRYAADPNAWQLLIHTNHTSIVHYFQEVAGMPNLFMPELEEAQGVDWEGRRYSRRVRVHRPVFPLYLALPEYIWLPDFAIAFPVGVRESLVRRLGERVMAPVLARQQELERRGVIRVGRYRQAEIAIVQVAPWTERVCAEMRESFARYPERYRLEAYEEARRRGELISN
jgi:aminoglycoside 3-N-acetyltransferase